MKEKTKKQLKKVILTAIFILSVFGFWEKTQAAVTKEISYQGKLTDENGVAVADGTYSMKISIYDASNGGSCLWTAQGSCSTPTAKSVTVANGIFSIMLGESGDNALSLDFNSAYWLGVTVGTDAEMSPRKKIGAAAYAFNSDLLDGLNSATSGADAHILATDSSGNITVSGATYFNGTTYYVSSSGTGNLNALTLAGDLDVKGADITNTTGALTITPQAGTNLNVALSTTGDFAVNTNQLYVDTSAGNIGIGTTSPSAMLSVGSTSQFQVNSTGAIAAATGITSSGTITFSGLGSGITKVTSGVLSVASAGTDYENPLTFSYPLSRATNTVSFGYNTTNLKLTSNQLNTIQDIATTSVPTFAALNTNGAVNLYYTSANNYSSGFNVYKRGTTGDATAPIAQFAELGYHSFFAWDGSAYGRGAYVYVNATQTWSTTAHGTNYSIYVTPNDSTTAALGLRIDQAQGFYIPGKVGIGASPSATYALNLTGTSYFSSSVGIGTAPNASYALAISGDQRIYGNFAVGTAPSSSYPINVVGNSMFSNNAAGTIFTIDSSNSGGVNTDGVTLQVKRNNNYTGLTASYTTIRASQSATAAIGYSSYSDMFSGGVVSSFYSGTDSLAHKTLRNFNSLFYLNTANTTIENAIGFDAMTYKYANTPTITNYYGFRSGQTYTTGWGFNTTNLYHYYVKSPTAGGTITNQYGLYLENLTTATNNYAIYSAGGTNILAGNTRIGGTTAPTVALDVTGAINASTYISANGAFTEASASVNAVTLGVTGSSARIKLDNANGTAWEMDNYDGSLRWFTPGNVLMTMDTLGNLSTSGTMKGNSTTHGIELKASGTSSSVGQIIMGSTSGYYQHSIKTVNTATASSNAIQFYLWDSGSSSDLGTLKVAEFLGDKKALFYGNVGIGQTNPTAKLHVYGDSGSTGANAPLALVAVGGIGGTGSTSDGYAGGGITLEGGIGGTSDQDYNGGAGGSVYISGGGGGEGYYDGGAGGNIYLNGGGGGTGYNNADGVSGNVVLANTRGNVRVGLGGYLNASSSDGRSLAMSAGGEYVSGWIARGTDFATMSLVAGDISFWTKTGLTSGNSFTPDQVMIIKSGGNVGIGTDSPDFKLQINGTVAPETSGQNLGDTSLRWNLNATAGNFSGDVSTSTLYITGMGMCDQLGSLPGGEVYCVSSDRRLKTSIEALSTNSALEKVMKLRGVNFNWNDKERFGEQREVGFIAQEVEAVVPELAFTQKNGIMGVKYAQMTALLTSAIQEQQKQIEENEISVSGLELKTTDSISTLADLKKTVDDQLAKITNKFSDLKDEINNQKSVEEELQKQIDELKLKTNEDLNWAKLSANTEDISYLKTLLGIGADTQPGDIKILGNFQAEKITVSGVETLRMTVVNDDTHPKTIGEVEIEPVSEGGESNGKSVKIKTKAVGKKSKIFVSPKGDEPINWIISDVDEGEGFEILVDKAVEKTVSFQWWVVEEK